MTHDYKRHGTTSPFAALEMATAEVIGTTYRGHRHHEVPRFRRKINKAGRRTRVSILCRATTRRTSKKKV